MLNVLLRGHLDWFTIVANLAVLCVVAFVVFPARGMAQAFVAYKLGDPTAKYNGRLSMNPLAHMDKYGIVVLFLCGLGFIKPIPINSRNFRNPRRDMILTILAGPVMGLLVGMLGVALYRVGLLFVTSAASVSKLWPLQMHIHRISDSTAMPQEPPTASMYRLWILLNFQSVCFLSGSQAPQNCQP